MNISLIAACKSIWYLYWEGLSWKILHCAVTQRPGLPIQGQVGGWMETTSPQLSFQLDYELLKAIKISRLVTINKLTQCHFFYVTK